MSVTCRPFYLPWELTVVISLTMHWLCYRTVLSRHSGTHLSKKISVHTQRQSSFISKHVPIMLRLRNIFSSSPTRNHGWQVRSRPSLETTTLPSDLGTKTFTALPRADLRRGIKTAKAAYKRKIEGHLSNSNPRRMWQGIQHLTNYKAAPTSEGAQTPHWWRT